MLDRCHKLLTALAAFTSWWQFWHPMLPSDNFYQRKTAFTIVITCKQQKNRDRPNVDIYPLYWSMAICTDYNLINLSWCLDSRERQVAEKHQEAPWLKWSFASDRKTERQKDRKTERQKDRDRDKDKDNKIANKNKSSQLTSIQITPAGFQARCQIWAALLKT